MGIVRNRNWNWNNWNTQPVIIHLKSSYVFLSHGAHISGVEFQYLIQLEGTFWSNNLTLFADRAGFWVDNTILPARILSVWIRVWTTRRRSLR